MTNKELCKELDSSEFTPIFDNNGEFHHIEHYSEIIGGKNDKTLEKYPIELIEKMLTMITEQFILKQ